jgi:tetratricopeptide (TPR) repeat protein
MKNSQAGSLARRAPQGGRGDKKGYMDSGNLISRINMGKSDALRREGKYLFASGKYEDAIKCLNRVLQKDPSDVDSWIYKGRALYFQHKYNDAIRAFEKALSCDSRNEDGWKGKIQCCDKLIELGAKNADAWDDKVEALINLGEYKQASEICDDAPGFSLKNAPRAWNCQGKALAADGGHEEAVKCYDKAIRHDAKFEDAWMNRGKALHLLGKALESIRCYDRALELNNKNAEAWALKGAALRDLFKYPEAEAAIAKAVKLGYRG